MKTNDLNDLAKRYRKELFEKFLLIKQGHPGSIYSMIEMKFIFAHSLVIIGA